MTVCPPVGFRLLSHVLVQDGDGLCIVVAANQRVHVVVQHRQAQLQDGLYPVVEKTVHHVDGTLYRQDADEESEEPGQGHRREEAQV